MKRDAIIVSWRRGDLSKRMLGMPFCVGHLPKVKPVRPAPAMVIGGIDMAVIFG